MDKIEKITGVKPVFYQLDLSPHPSPLLWEEREQANITLDDIFAKHNFDWVLHFAGLKAVWESTTKPFYYYDKNVIWALNLFEAMEKYWVKNIIFSSSAFLWLNELDEVWDCTNPYWTTKFLIENILRDLSIHKWFRVIALRYFNPVWAHKSWLIWENPKWLPNNLLPFVMKVATWELEEVWVFWNDYDTIDWTWVRDYIHVLDLSKGHLQAWDWLNSNQSIPTPSFMTKGREENKWFFEVFNLWTWNWTSVLEMINLTSEIVGKNLKYKILPRRAWDLAEVYCDASKAKSILNWEAKLSIKEAIEDSWNFMNKN